MRILWWKFIGEVFFFIALPFLFWYLVPVFVVSHQIITAAPQGTTYYLFAKQLRTKGTHATDVGNGVSIPSFCQHTYTYHTTNVCTQRARLTYAVHYFTQDVGVLQLVGTSRTILGIGYPKPY